MYRLTYKKDELHILSIGNYRIFNNGSILLREDELPTNIESLYSIEGLTIDIIENNEKPLKVLRGGNSKEKILERKISSPVADGKILNEYPAKRKRTSQGKE